ncbi:MAG: hypothetical protein IPH20_18925 [Bacteroidales bacterium]|nr:hypothetical protein [Bacteroidales bacterium]
MDLKTDSHFCNKGILQPGFNSHQWAWSTDGTNFTNFGINTAPTSTSTFLLRALDLRFN